MIDWSQKVVGPCVGIFGQPATFQNKYDDPVTVNVIFDNAFKLMKMTEYGPELAGTFPAAGVDLADFPTAPVQGDELTIDGHEYIIRMVEADSHGGAMLILNKQ